MPPITSRIDHIALVSALSKKVVSFISSKAVTFTDDKTNLPKVLYKSHFLTTSDELLTYWLEFPLTIQVNLPQVELHIEEKVKNDKFTLVVKDVIVL